MTSSTFVFNIAVSQGRPQRKVDGEGFSLTQIFDMIIWLNYDTARTTTTMIITSLYQLLLYREGFLQRELKAAPKRVKEPMSECAWCLKKTPIHNMRYRSWRSSNNQYRCNTAVIVCNNKPVWSPAVFWHEAFPLSGYWTATLLSDSISVVRTWPGEADPTQTARRPRLAEKRTSTATNAPRTTKLEALKIPVCLAQHFSNDTTNARIAYFVCSSHECHSASLAKNTCMTSRNWCSTV